MSETFHLAQVNVARFAFPPDAPELRAFFAKLASINALADNAPGFVWRLVGEGDDATDLRPDPADAELLINMSVWVDLPSLAAFVYRSDHVTVMRRRREWFGAMDLYMALWWVPADHRPTPLEALIRLRHLRDHGPTATAFTFRDPFPQPMAMIGPDRILEMCGA
jgi:hypothetical protein